MNNDWVYVLDYNVGQIYEIHLEEKEKDLPIEDILYSYGLNEDECSWMISEKQLNIEYIEKI